MKPEIHQAAGYKFMAGYLLNFGHQDTIEWKRFTLSEFCPSASMSAD
jgi:hypothetical protein